MRVVKARRTAVGVAAAFALALPALASAHASLVRSTPRDGTVLATAPASVRFVFDDDVRVRSGIKAVRNEDGSVLAGKPRVVDGRTLVVPLRAGLGDGDYTVLWRVLSDDGHTLEGVISFGVGRGRPPPEAALSAGGGPSLRDVVSRWLFFAGLLTAVGTAFFRLAIGPIRPRVLLGAFLLVFLGGSDAIGQASISTRFGTVMAIAVGIAAAGALFAALAPLYAPLELAAIAAALGLLPLPTLAGHALDAGRPRIEILVDLLHVTAASVWLGGLVSLALALRAGLDRAVLLRRFSNIAAASIVVLAVTGVIRAFSELDAVSQLWSTGYGRTLIVKTGLLTVLVGVGWLNRYRLIPRRALGVLRRSVAAELVLFVGLAAAVALLTDLRPGRDRVAAAAPTEASAPPPLPARNMVVVAREDGELAVALAAKPPGAEVVVLSSSGNGVDGLDVTIAGVRAGKCGPGCYGAFFKPTTRVRVTIDGRPLAFRVPTAPRPANLILARATRAFRRLRTVSYVERLASDPRNRVVADFTLERPDRLEYRIRGGATGIIIGARRWDRTGRGPWVQSDQQPTEQPEPVWAGPVTNAYLLEATASTYVVSFLKPVGPAWFTVRFDRRTLLPRDVRMTAPAHFMTHLYRGFNEPARIKAPDGGR
jgi:copper transport protein